jgi:putative component of toxin-antitoxin plasmid stabilization module
VADIELLDEIVEWLAALSDAEYERAVVLIDRLAELGSRARMPFSRSLGQGLFELRFSLGSNSQRITYRFAKGDRIVLLTTFHKQRMNERTEIDRARRIAEADASERP